MTNDETYVLYLVVGDRLGDHFDERLFDLESIIFRVTFLQHNQQPHLDLE